MVWLLVELLIERSGYRLTIPDDAPKSHSMNSSRGFA